jgi:hypothetical protein
LSCFSSGAPSVWRPGQRSFIWRALDRKVLLQRTQGSFSPCKGSVFQAACLGLLVSLFSGGLLLAEVQEVDKGPSKPPPQGEGGSPGETQGAGIVYGPSCAFLIKAPPHWVLDNESGQRQGLSCVFYPEGSSWAEADTVMYAELSGPEFHDEEAFARQAVDELLHHNPDLKPRLLEKGKTAQGLPYLLYEYPPTKKYPVSERAAYIGLGCGVASIVMSSRSAKSYQRCLRALKATLDSVLRVQIEPNRKGSPPASGQNPSNSL